MNLHQLSAGRTGQVTAITSPYVLEKLAAASVVKGSIIRVISNYGPTVFETVQHKTIAMGQQWAQAVTVMPL